MTTNWSKCPKFNMNPSKDIQRLENPLTNSPWQRHFDPELGAQTGAGILLLRVRRVRRGWWHLFVNSQVFTGFCQIARGGCQINKIPLKIWQKDGLYYLYIYIYYIENMNTPCVWKLDIPPNGNFKRDDDKPLDLGPMFLTNPVKATCPAAPAGRQAMPSCIILRLLLAEAWPGVRCEVWDTNGIWMGYNMIYHLVI